MRARDEIEAAYFALLRARDELRDLRAYAEYLAREQRRLARFVTEGTALADEITVRFRRRLAHTDAAILDGLRQREEAITDELRRLPDRISAAEAFVEECERDHERLRARG